MKRLRVMTVLVLTAFLGVSAFTQTPAATEEQTVEDIYLNSSVEVQIIRALAGESGRQNKDKALEYIKKMIDENKVTSGSVDVLYILEDLSGEGVAREVRVNRALMNDYSEIRRKSAELLGRVGGQRAQQTLITVALTDPEPSVVAEAIYSLGMISGDDNGDSEKVIAHLMGYYNVNSKIDNNLAFAAISAIEKIGKSKNGKIRPELFSTLSQIQNSNYIRAVKKKAERVLDQMRAY